MGRYPSSNVIRERFGFRSANEHGDNLGGRKCDASLPDFEVFVGEDGVKERISNQRHVLRFVPLEYPISCIVVLEGSTSPSAHGLIMIDCIWRRRNSNRPTRKCRCGPGPGSFELLVEVLGI